MRPPKFPKGGLLKSLTHKNSLILFHIFQRLKIHFIYFSSLIAFFKKIEHDPVFIIILVEQLLYFNQQFSVWKNQIEIY
jgi:hypothetical protein